MRCELPTGNLHTFYCIIPDKALRALCSVQGRQWNEHITDASHWRACDARGIGFPREGIINEDRQAENDWDRRWDRYRAGNRCGSCATGGASEI